DRDCFRREQPDIDRAGDLHAMRDVIVGFFLRQRLQMKTQAHALQQLLQFRRFNQFVERRLSQQNDVQDLFLLGLEPGQHANLFKHLDAQVVGIVDDQNELLALVKALDQEGIEHVDQLNLFGVERIQPELDEHGLKKFDFIELCLEDLRHQHIVVVEFGQQQC